MALARIAPNSEKKIPTSARYLNIVTSSGELYVYNEEAGITEFLVKQNSIIETDAVKSLYFVNKSNVELLIEYQSTGLKVLSGDSGTVSITGSVVVDSITKGITIDASIGSVEILPANTTDDIADITLAANEKRLLVSADDKRKELTIQLSGNDFVSCRVGSANVANNRGKILQGGGGQVGSMSHTATDAVYIKNTSAFDVTVSIGVEKRV